MRGRDTPGYVVSPTLTDCAEAVVFVPGLGGRTRFVERWNEPGRSSIVRRADWSRPMSVPPIDERGAALASLVEESGVTDVVLIGHSMGGLVCLEAGSRLGNRLRGAVIMCQYPPHRTPLSALAELPDRALAEELDAPAHIRHTAALQEYARLWRAEYHLLNAYLESDPRPLLTAPVIVVGARDDESAHDTECLGDWGQYTTGPLSVRTVDGGHQVVEELPAETLHSWLAEVRG